MAEATASDGDGRSNTGISWANRAASRVSRGGAHRQFRDVNEPDLRARRSRIASVDCSASGIKRAEQGRHTKRTWRWGGNSRRGSDGLLTKMIYSQDIVTRGSEQLCAQGVRVLQGNRFAPTELGHLNKLIAYMKLNGERAVADMGCGFGEVSLMMTSAIPRARFWLVNQNAYQLHHCPMIPEFTLLCEDMCATSIPRSSVDLVMFNYSLCYVNILESLEEAAAIARRGGESVVF